MVKGLMFISAEQDVELWCHVKKEDANNETPEA